MKSRESWEQEQKADGIGLTEADDNPEWLSSEMNWLRGKLDEMLVRALEEIGRNCDHGHGWHGAPPARLLSAGMDDEDLLASLPRLVLGINKCCPMRPTSPSSNCYPRREHGMISSPFGFTPTKSGVSEEFAGNVDRLLSRE